VPRPGPVNRPAGPGRAARRPPSVQLAPSGSPYPIILRTGRGDARITIEEAQRLQSQLYRVLLAAVVGLCAEGARDAAGFDDVGDAALFPDRPLRDGPDRV
jgi:hypothetical protein